MKTKRSTQRRTPGPPDERINGRDLVLESESPKIRELIGTTIVDSFVEPSGTMLPTLFVGDKFFVTKGPLEGAVKRGDVVAFQSPQDNQRYVKRVVALGGDRIDVHAGTLKLDGKPVPSRPIVALPHSDDAAALEMLGRPDAEIHEEVLDGRTYRTLHLRNDPWSIDASATVPEGSVFVLGDNRDLSLDSRQFGPLPLSSIVGHATVVYLSTAGPANVRWNRVGRVIQ